MRSARCPKCNFASGDDWEQCGGDCPVPGSPHFNERAGKVVDFLLEDVRGEVDEYTRLKLIHLHAQMHKRYSAIKSHEEEIEKLSQSVSLILGRLKRRNTHE